MTWLFANRNFAWDHRSEILAGSSPEAVPDSFAADLEALRVHDRFGITSWPQMIVCDPRDTRVIGMPERTTESVTALFDRALGALTTPVAIRLPEQSPTPLELERLLLRLEAGESTGVVVTQERAQLLERLLVRDGSDIVVRLRALQIMLRTDPETVRQHAPALLGVPNDPFRYAVLGLLAEQPDPTVEKDLLRLFTGAGTEVPSLNPNVLRINAVRALGSGGGPEAIEAFAAVLAEPEPRNYLHRLLVETCGEIGARADDSVRARITGVLLGAVPAAVVGGADEDLALTEDRLARAMARSIRAACEHLTGNSALPAVPGSWRREDRENWLEALQSALGGQAPR